MSTSSQPARNRDLYAKVKTMAAATFGMAVFMVAIKTYLFFATDAVSFLALMLDSLMDVGLSAATLIGVYWAAKPADSRHRYGYGKVEALLAMFQSLFLALAALSISWLAGMRLVYPQALTAHVFEIGLTVFVFFANLGLVALQNKVVNETNSLAIKGDRAHYTSDVFTNGGVLVLLILNLAMPAYWLDPFFTLAIAAFLLYNAYVVASGAANMLLDKESPEELREEMFVAASMVDGVAGVHDLRIIDRGLRLSLSLDIEMDGDLSLIAAHNIAKDVENALLKIAPNAEIMIHMDPVGDREDSRHIQLKPLHFT